MEEQERDPREEVAKIFTSAGWTAGDKDGWDGQFVWRGGVVVGGIDPHGIPRATGIVANPNEGPSDVVAAAHWLVEHAKQHAPENPLTTEATLETPVAQQSEGVESQGDESNGETGEEAGGNASDQLGAESDLSDGLPSGLGELDAGSAEGLAETSGEDAQYERAEPDLIDADFTEGQDLGSELLDVESELHAPELPAPDPEDFAPDEIEHPETGSGAFIFGDNLDQLRTAAIGLVIRYANSLMPKWSIEDDARLAYLRNFAMGVSEKRWDDNPALSAELNALETTIRRINEIKNARDGKVEFLEGASREEIVDFAVEADWP